MADHGIPGSSLSRGSSNDGEDNNNNSGHKRLRDDRNDNGPIVKRRKGVNDNTDDNDVSAEHPSHPLGPGMLPSPPATPSDDETLDDVDVDLDDLETIPDDAVDDLEDTLGDVDLTNEDAIIGSLGVAEPSPPATPPPASNNIEVNAGSFSSEDDVLHVGSWSQSSQGITDEDLFGPEPITEMEPQSQPQRARPRARQPMPGRHIRRWIRCHSAKEYFRFAMTDYPYSDDEF